MSLETRIVQDAADAIIAADASGKIQLWNAGAERLFGFSAAEALTQSLDIIIPEAQRKRHWDGFGHVMGTGITKYGTQLLRVPAIRKDGSRVSIAFTVGLLKDAAGAMEGIFAVMRDDTERWETEKELRKRVAELERGAPRDARSGPI
jgi:PAS domain S-box-containing protein